MSRYQQQVRCAPGHIDLDYWRAPEGVSVPDDELRFLLVPDAVEAAVVGDLSRQVHRYQRRQSPRGAPISCALMATMGGLLPGILLYDHLVHGREAGGPRITFGTIGISLYAGPNERRDGPRVEQDISVPVAGQVVLLIDDLGDSGDTLQFLKDHVASRGARQVLTLAVYMKPDAIDSCPVEFSFGTVAQDTWIITPREMVETLAKRVPVWRERGAGREECRRRLVDLIGYPPALVDYYLPRVY